MEGATPLFEDPSAPQELRSFVAMARGDGPSQADLDRLAARLGPAVGLSAGVLATGAAVLGTAPSGVSGAPAVAAAKAGTLSKLLASSSGKLVLAGLSLGIGAGLWALTGTRPEPTPAELTRSAPVVARQTEPTVVEEPKAPVEPATLEPVALAPAPKRARPVAGQRARPRPLAEKLAAPEPTLVDKPAPSELGLIQQAESARGRSGEALAILAQHEHLYPRGALAQERDVLVVEMLIKAGDVAKARSRAARFEAQYPSSAHLPRLRALLARTGGE